MTITLTPEQQAWIQEHVASGEFSSPEEAARRLIDAAIIERALDETDDLAWAKPLIDEALADVEQGRVITLEEHQARNAARLAAMKMAASANN